MIQGLAARQATGLKMVQPWSLAWLAEAYRSMGKAAAGLSSPDDALALGRSHGAGYNEAELHRLTGELLQARAIEAHAGAEGCFQQALDMARH
jgi:predicted ATPase